MNSHILFITSSNLATNPRCLKEIKLALSLECKVSVIKFNLNNWSRPLEDNIEQSLPQAKFYNVNAGRDPFYPWLMSTFLSVAGSVGCRLFPANGYLHALAAGKRTWLILKVITKFSVRADFIIAHNPAAFWPAFALAKKIKVPFAIDVEDYHPGEFDNIYKAINMEVLMKKVLPSARYVSFASSPIQQLTVTKIPAITKSFVLHNCFEKNEFLLPGNSVASSKLKIVWFSQNINHSRGLELVLPVLAQFKELVTVTLIGNINSEFAKKLESFYSFLKIVPPLLQTELHHLLKSFDIGLAVEPGKDLNNDIALSNKIWSYFQAGLFILASATTGQKELLQEHNFHGILFDFKKDSSLQEAIGYLIQNKEDIRIQKVDRYKKALNNSWEKEAGKLLQEWKEALAT